MDADEGFDDEGGFSAWVSPDDRLWRHPSEAAAGRGRSPLATSSSPRVRGPGPRTWTTALIAGVVGALLASGIGLATGGFGRSTVVRSYATLSSPATTVTETDAIDPSAVPVASWAAIYQQLARSMVMISGSGDAGEVSTSGMLWEQTAAGTAYILCAGEDLDGVNSVNVAFSSGYSARGKVVGTDPQTGIAVVSVNERLLPVWALPQFPPLGTLTDMHVGDALATVGSGSQANGSFVTGAVSSLDRAVTDSDDDLVMLGMIAVATAGPVIHGAAVVESNGDVVGLTVEGGEADSNPQLLSYAVPIDVASDIATQLINGQQPWHPWIGVLQAEDLPSGQPGGAEVDSVAPGSPAAKAGLQQTDVIVKLDNIPVDSTGSLLQAMNKCARDTTVPVRYLRQGKAITTTVAVTAQPANP